MRSPSNYFNILCGYSIGKMDVSVEHNTRLTRVLIPIFLVSIICQQNILCLLCVFLRLVIMRVGHSWSNGWCYLLG